MNHDGIFTTDIIDQHLALSRGAVDSLHVNINFQCLRVAVLALDITYSCLILEILAVYYFLSST